MVQMWRGAWRAVVFAAVLTGAAATATAQEEEEAQAGPTYGVGLETGFFFSDFDRFSREVLESNDRAGFETAGAQLIEVAVESVLLEHFRLGLNAGVSFPWQSNPSLAAWHLGLEPAYAAGADDWEMALGLLVGVGAMRIVAEDGAKMQASLTLLRPFLEVRRHMGEGQAVYGRAGFNQIYPGNPRSEELELVNRQGRALTTVDLSTGGIFLSVGFRYGALKREREGLEGSPQEERLEGEGEEEATD